jgi:predicted transcriptional regulator
MLTDSEDYIKMNRKEQIRNSKKQKAAKKGAEFQKLDEEDMKLINKTVNDKRQNLVQALKDYYKLLLSVKQAIKFQERLEEYVDIDGEIKDHLGLPMSKEEKVCEVQMSFIQLRFMKADLLARQKDFKETWGIDEDKLEHYYEKWFIEGNELEL